MQMSVTELEQLKGVVEHLKGAAAAFDGYARYKDRDLTREAAYILMEVLSDVREALLQLSQASTELNKLVDALEDTADRKGAN